MKTPAYDIHLVCGGSGAGKSVVSERLKQEMGTVVFPSMNGQGFRKRRIHSHRKKRTITMVSGQ